MKNKTILFYCKINNLEREVSSEYRNLIRTVSSKQELFRQACRGIIVTDQNQYISELYELGATHVFLGSGYWRELKAVVLEDSESNLDDFFKQSFVTRDIKYKESIKRSLRTLAQGSLPLLITGESGTGKTHLAQKIHQYLRPDTPFVAKSLKELPSNLIESALFGHKKGAFTGADKNHTGLLERVNGGTLFLDEIATLDCEIQAKLLKVLDEKQFSPLGSNELIRVDFQLITATCDPLEKLLSEKKIRHDFYYRLAGLELSIPPLRQRTNDIEALIKNWQRSQKRQFYFVPNALAEIKNYSWPGNIRELHYYLEGLKAQRQSVITSFSIDSRHSQEDHALDLPTAIKNLERQYFEKSFYKNEGRPNRICQELNISKSVYYRLREQISEQVREQIQSSPSLQAYEA